MTRRRWLPTSFTPGAVHVPGAVPSPEAVHQLAPLAALLLAIVVSSASAAEPKSKAEPAARGDETWYAKSIARGEGGMLIVNYWSKGARFRAETVVTGHTIVTLVNGDHYYTLDPVSGRGVKIERSARAVAQDAGRRRPFANDLDRLRAAGGEKVGSDELLGQTYDVYRLTDDKGKRELWVAPGKVSIPVQVKTFHRDTAMTEVLNYAGWMTGLGIADSQFTPDPRIELDEMSYEEYVRRSSKGPVGPAPVLYKHLLHGEAN